MKRKIVAISDQHGVLPKIEPCDLLIIAGDICPAYNHDVYFQMWWLSHEYLAWLKGIEAQEIIFIAGNHDFVFEEEHVAIKLPATYLQDSSVMWKGLKVWGTPHQLVFFDWAFNLTEKQLEKKWELIPEDTNILIAHSPPYGIGDECPAMRWESQYPGLKHAGSATLLARIQELKQLKLIVYGHIHEGRGRWEINGVTYMNASILDGKYNHVHEPHVIEMDTPE